MFQKPRQRDATADKDWWNEKGKVVAVLLRNLLTIVVTVFLADNALAQDAANVKKPLEAVLRSTTWIDVLSKDHDLTATVHFGEEENARVSMSNEGVCISRQIHDSHRATASKFD